MLDADIIELQEQEEQQQTPSSSPSPDALPTQCRFGLTPMDGPVELSQRYKNEDGNTALHLACISGFVDIVASLIRLAPHPCLLNIHNDMAQTLLHLTALTALPTILRLLLLAGADATLRNLHGKTAQHLCCIAGEKQGLSTLAEKFGVGSYTRLSRIGALPT